MTPIVHIVSRRGWVLALALLTASPVVAQRINFGAYTTSRGITLSGDLYGTLDFTPNHPIASNSGSTVTIALNDALTQYIAITGDATRDITITVSAPTVLMTGGGGTNNEIPFTCRFAYSNLGSGDVNTAKLVAVQVPGGFTAITLPILRRMSGAPAPPPTPAHGGYTPPPATAYLFLYGTLGPVVNVNAGNYSGTITVTVQY